MRIQTVIQDARRRLILGDVARGLSRTGSVILAIGLALCLADTFIQLPAGLRLAALALSLGGAAALLQARVLMPARRRRRPEAVAVELERRFGVDQNKLINAWQFEEGRLSPVEAPFAGEVAREAEMALLAIPRSELLGVRPLRREGLLFGVTLLAVVLYGVSAPRYAWNALQRLVLPLADIPPAGRVILTLRPDEPVALDEGEPLTVMVLAQSADGQPLADPPVIRFRERTAFMPPRDPGGSAPGLLPLTNNPFGWSYTFPKAERSFAFRVFAADTCTRSVAVTVKPAPRLTASAFTVEPPAYAGLPAGSRPGPPAALSALPGSRITASLKIEPVARGVTWVDADGPRSFARGPDGYTLAWVFTNAGAYRILAEREGSGPERILAQGRLTLEEDQPPAVEFETADRNRFVNPGATIEVPVRAEDDYGVRLAGVRARRMEEKNGNTGKLLRVWTFMGPPGPRKPATALFSQTLDPAAFPPGSVWALEAEAADFAPGERTGKSAPILVRIREARDVGTGDGQTLTRAFALLRETIAAQEKANMTTENLKLNLEDAVRKKSLEKQSATLKELQGAAQASGRKALDAFRQAAEEGASTALRLEPLVNGEMENLRDGLGRLAGEKGALEPRIAVLRERQDALLAALLALLGRAADQAAKPKPAVQEKADEPTLQEARRTAEELREDLLDFIDSQKKTIEKSKSLLDKAPQDLTAEEEKILGELAREEAKWATYFEEKLTDFSKLPLQDFADGVMADEFNETFMEMKKAAKALYEKNVELAVPHEQSGLENAEKLVQNLEKWLSDKPDNLKWLMEEPMAQADIAMADLPAELEDIVGELLDKEEEMTEEVEDVSSSWLDSPDKGAGWDALDGPISSMSAKGVTGNMLPNQMEIGGRAGEGRSGRSSGQMVENTAQGKGGRETPTRLSPGPFESGSVEDSSKESPGGATGGGKLSGFAGEGLRGPVPPPLQQKMARLAGQQAAIRQSAEALALRLRAWNVPGADLETAVQHMRGVEESAAKGYGPGVRQAFTQVIETLGDARRAAGGAGVLRREQTALPDKLRQEITSGLQDGIPAGYEEMAGAYFRELAEPGR